MNLAEAAALPGATFILPIWAPGCGMQGFPTCPVSVPSTAWAKAGFALDTSPVQGAGLCLLKFMSES